MYYNYKNIKLHYDMIGEGKPVLLLHGLGCNMDMMKGCMEPVFFRKGQYKRIYVDLPGMGKSGAEKEFASADCILELLSAFVKDKVQEPFLLVGESYGGYLARGVVSEFLHEVDGIMLLCFVAIPQLEERTLPATDFKSADEDFLATLSKSDREEFCAYTVAVNEEVYQRYREEIKPGFEVADGSFIDKLRDNYAFSFDVYKKMKEAHFHKPALFLCGRQDICVGYHDQWNLLEDYPRATFGIIDVAGHNLQIEQPELFNALVLDWLKRVEN